MSQINKITVRTKPSDRPFDFGKYETRHVALLVSYLGWDYDGLVLQKNSANTIEEYLHDAFRLTKLVQNREECNFKRCGRTDKGVSAFSQVISLVLRSARLTDGSNSASFDDSKELLYTKMMCGCLPEDIRVLAWAPVDDEFDARISCTKRTYKYAFPRGSLDIQAMNTASAHLLGEHDYRNFCRIDMNAKRVQQSYIRRIMQCHITPVDQSALSIDCASTVTSSTSSSPYEMYELTVVGSGFLWHMIRCIMAVIVSVGKGLEPQDITLTLLDIVRTPARPDYAMAKDIPLCLHECEYANDDIRWRFDEETMRRTRIAMQKKWAEMQTKSLLIRRMLDTMPRTLHAPRLTSIVAQHEFVDMHGTGRGNKEYKPMLKRPMADSLEVKRAKLAVKDEAKRVKAMNEDEGDVVRS